MVTYQLQAMWTILQVDVQSNNIQAYPSYLKQRKHHNANLCWLTPCYSVLGKSLCRRKTQQLDVFVSQLCAQFGGMFPFIFPLRIRKNCNKNATKNTILIVVPILLLCHRIRLYASKRHDNTTRITWFLDQGLGWSGWYSKCRCDKTQKNHAKSLMPYP